MSFDLGHDVAGRLYILTLVLYMSVLNVFFLPFSFFVNYVKLVGVAVFVNLLLNLNDVVRIPNILLRLASKALLDEIGKLSLIVTNFLLF